MSTSTNTLFRFVTMRGPEKFRDGSRFLYHPDPETLGHFKTLLTSPATGRTLQRQNQLTLAGTFTPVTDDEDLADIVGYDLIMYTRWMIKHLDAISKTPGYVTSYPEYGIVLNEREYTEANIVDLWDNLFYQIITGEDPQMRDFLMYLLIALRVIHSDSTPEQDKNVFSKVVIPKNFFGLATGPAPAEEEEEDEEGRTGLPGLATGTVYARLNEKIGVVKAKEKIGNIANAVKEIEKAKKTWERANRTSYEAQRQIHDAELEGAMKTAMPVIDEETGKPYYDGLDLPAFSFTPSDQLTSGVAATFSDQSRQILDELNLTYPVSFDAVLEDLAASLRQETDTVFTGSNPVRPVMTIGDVLIPVDDELTPSAPVHSYSIQLEQIRGSKYKVYLAIHTGYNNPSALDARYSSSFEGVSEPVQLSAFNSEALGSTLVLELYPDGLTVPDGVLAFSIDGEVTLSNGLRVIFSTVLQLEGGATGVMNVDESNAAGPGHVDVYVPTGFGIKQLGIADYRKVEQTVCCYVPGEVSHIENIMAREYKEKSTRRFRSSEETTTTETEKEKEQLTDTTSTSRYDMQQEVASIINKDSSTQTNTNFSANYPSASISMAAGYAQNNSQQQSNSQAISYAKDVTERALERVVQRVREERISKVVEEYEEQNKHGFDNREGDSHVSGVYRWVDKIFKNSIRNYGKRLMYEFMIPQPAVFHLEALKHIPGANPGVILTRPVDPRSEEAGVNRIATFNEITEFNYKYWAAAYNAEVEPCVEKLKTIGKSFAGAKFGDHELTDGSADLQIPEGYVAKRANVKLYAKYDGDTKQMHSFGVNVGNISHWYDEQRYSIRKDDNVYLELDNYKGQLPLSYFCENYHTFNIAVTVRLEATEELINKWKQETFDAILKAYNQKRLEYEDALAVNSQSAKVNPGFFRQIENTVLRKNCITYLVGHNNLGKELYSGEGVINKKPLDNADLDQYSSLVKFIEQAFEWNEISYTLYPFYWAGKNNWQSLYQQEVDDALFRSFLQSGMARVIATVRPGFEEAVMHYMATGQVWNGSQPPVIGDELYLSVIEELRNPEYEIEESWESRVPTSLTVIQAGGIALDVDGLPCECGDDEETGISQSESKLGVAGDPPVDQ